MPDKVDESSVMTRVGVYMTEETRRMLRSVSFHEERSISELVNEALRQWFSSREKGAK